MLLAVAARMVLFNDDRGIISRLREVKALGILMGAPLYQVRHQLEHDGVQVFSALKSIKYQASTQ